MTDLSVAKGYIRWRITIATLFLLVINALSTSQVQALQAQALQAKQDTLKAQDTTAFYPLQSQDTLKAQDNTAFNPQRAEYLWPTSASTALSGTFGETRSRHFHAALDIKTWGRRGYPVYATRPGTLYRMAIGPTGYGKVLYLKHTDGSYSIYAHLLRFNEELQQLADSIRLRDYSPSFDMVVDTMNIKVEQGEQIALSGASGIGPPHLHFELRTPEEAPFNPLRTNLKIRDTIKPSFSGLAVMPLSVKSKIEGTNSIYRRTPSRKSGFADFGTIVASGTVGLAVDVFDQANGVPNVYAAYKLKLTVDGQEVFRSKVDQFTYGETDQMFLDRVYPLLKSDGKGFQRLYVADGNTLSFYTTAGNGGRLELAPGIHDIRIEAEDYYGNRRQAKLTLSVKPKEVEPYVHRRTIALNKSKGVDPNRWTWFDDWVNIPLDDFKQLTLAPLIASSGGPAYFKNGNTVSVDLAYSPQFYFRTSPADFFVSRRANPNQPTYLVSPDDRAYASFPSGTFYDTTSVAMTKKVRSGGAVEVNLFPDNKPVRNRFSISVQLDSAQLADTTLSFYKTRPGSRHLSKTETKRKGRYLTASPSSLGRYTVLPDTAAPLLGTPRIVQSADDRWLVYVPAKDPRSGINYRRTEIYVNGIRGLSEYEPEDSRLVYYHPDFKPKSSNRVRIVAYDKIGNRVTMEAKIGK
jgi:hypothetical protein